MWEWVSSHIPSYLWLLRGRCEKNTPSTVHFNRGVVEECWDLCRLNIPRSGRWDGPLDLITIELLERTVLRLGLTSCAKEARVNKFMTSFSLVEGSLHWLRYKRLNRKNTNFPVFKETCTLETTCAFLVDTVYTTQLDTVPVRKIKSSVGSPRFLFWNM